MQLDFVLIQCHLTLPFYALLGPHPLPKAVSSSNFMSHISHYCVFLFFFFFHNLPPPFHNPYLLIMDGEEHFPDMCEALS